VGNSRPLAAACVENSSAAATAFVLATATGAGLKTGTGIADGVKQTVAKGKDALKPKESKVELPPGVDRPD
jgi:hypothetical protein